MHFLFRGKMRRPRPNKRLCETSRFFQWKWQFTEDADGWMRSVSDRPPLDDWTFVLISYKLSLLRNPHSLFSFLSSICPSPPPSFSIILSASNVERGLPSYVVTYLVLTLPLHKKSFGWVRRWRGMEGGWTRCTGYRSRLSCVQCTRNPTREKTSSR